MTRTATDAEVAQAREDYEASWSSLEILRCPLPDAVAALFRQIEISAEVRRLVGPIPEPLLSLGLNALAAELFERCPASPVTRESFRQIGIRPRANQMTRCERAALDAERFAGLFGRVLQLLETQGIVWRKYGRRGLEAVTTDKFDQRHFRLDSRARLQWEELDYRKLREVPLLVRLARNDLWGATDVVLDWQTSSVMLDDNWNTGPYSVRQWRAVLRRLIAVTLVSLEATPPKTTLLQPLDLRTLSFLAQRAGVSEGAYRSVLDDLTLHPQGPTVNLAATPFVPIGANLLLTIPSLMLLRRADVLLLRRWSERAPSKFNHRLISRQVHATLAQLFRNSGLRAFADVSYTSVVNRKQRDVDVLVGDSTGSWLVVQVKGFLPPAPGSEPIRARDREYREGFEQIEDALLTLAREPGRLLARREGRGLRAAGPRCEGLLVVTYKLDEGADQRFPVMTLPVLREWLQAHAPTSIDALVASARVDASSEPISWLTAWSNGFFLRYPYLDWESALHFPPPWSSRRARWNALLSKLVFWSLWIGAEIQRLRRLGRETNVSPGS